MSLCLLDHNNCGQINNGQTTKKGTCTINDDSVCRLYLWHNANNKKGVGRSPPKNRSNCVQRPACCCCCPGEGGGGGSMGRPRQKPKEITFQNTALMQGCPEGQQLWCSAGPVWAGGVIRSYLPTLKVSGEHLGGGGGYLKWVSRTPGGRQPSNNNNNRPRPRVRSQIKGHC